MGRWVLFGILALPWAAGCAVEDRGYPALRGVPEQVEPWRYGAREGYRVRSAHYDIYTTLDNRALAEQVPQVLESAYVFYQQLVPPAEPLKRRMKLYLFEHRPEFVAFTKKLAPAKAGKLTQVKYGGYSERGIAVMRYGQLHTTFALLAHEGFHQYVFFCVGQDFPAWLNEGLATVCEGQRWNRERLESFDARFNPQRRNDLAEAVLADEMTPLSKLLEINAGHVVGSTSKRIRRYYAQVWALMLFLMDGPYQEGFEDLKRDLASGAWRQRARAAYVSSEEAHFSLGRELFRAYIEADLAVAEVRLRRFIEERIIEPETDNWLEQRFE